MILFPELRRYNTVEDRVREVDANHHEFRTSFRAHQAASWKKARAKLRSLPTFTREGILRVWNAGNCPSDPVYLLSTIRECLRVSPWRKLRARAYVRRGFGQQALALFQE